MAESIHFQFNKKNYLFTLRLGFLLFCICFFSVFCVLGVWQLYRYQSKQELLATYQTRLQSAPIAFSDITGAWAAWQFQPVLVSGTYANAMTMFISGVLYHGQSGYEVLTPFWVAGTQKLVIIDRGWINPSNHNRPPTVQPVLGVQWITGYIKLLGHNRFMLGANIADPNHVPLVMQSIDIAELNKLTHKVFFPVVVRLSANAPHGFIRDWPVVNVMPQRHLAYAIQWFVMALVVLIGSLAFCCQRIGE